MNDAYRDLLTLAARIPPDSDGGMMQDYLDEACADHARELLDAGGDPHAIAASLNADLDAIAQDPHANPRAVQHVRNSLMANFDLSAPAPRAAAPKPERDRSRSRSRLPLILLAMPVLLAGGYASLRYVNEIAITRPFDTHDGMVQRARAIRKIVAAEKRKHTESGLLATLSAWPQTPSESEIAGAADLSERLLKAGASLAIEGCGTAPDDSTATGDTGLTTRQKFLDGVARDLIAQDGKWQTKPSTTLRDTVREYQCPNRAARPQTGLTQ